VVETPAFVRTQQPVEEAAVRLVAAVEAIQREQDAVRLAIPGGSALLPLRAARAALGLRWARVRLCWVDERCVPFAHADSNRGLAYRSGALDAAHPPEVELPLWQDGETQDAAVARVESGLDQDFDAQLDVLLLGMGADGHVASLFPHVRPAATANAARVSDSPKPPARRITLTLRILRSARYSVLLATGEAKRPALERLARGDPALPACGLRGLVVVTDPARQREEAT
jgi:6-phosphogluconolactonase